MSDESHDAAGVGRPVRSAFLHRPDPPTDGVVRTELSARLDEGLDRSATLVCAPAGFGKSVLVSQWSRETGRRACWLTIDPTIDHPQWFLMHFVAAVRSVFPDALEVTSQMASAATLPAEAAVITELSNELDELPEPLIVVLDDYHHVTKPAVHRLISELVTYPSPMLRLVIVTREEPPLPIGTLRGKGDSASCEVPSWRSRPTSSGASWSTSFATRSVRNRLKLSTAPPKDGPLAPGLRRRLSVSAVVTRWWARASSMRRRRSSSWPR